MDCCQVRWLQDCTDEFGSEEWDRLVERSAVFGSKQPRNLNPLVKYGIPGPPLSLHPLYHPLWIIAIRKHPLGIKYPQLLSSSQQQNCGVRDEKESLYEVMGKGETQEGIVRLRNYYWFNFCVFNYRSHWETQTRVNRLTEPHLRGFNWWLGTQVKLFEYVVAIRNEIPIKCG